MSYYLESIEGYCPTQAWGVVESGERFYFRYRYGCWSLEVGRTTVARGETGDSHDGVMNADEVRAILDTHLNTPEPPTIESLNTLMGQWQQLTDTLRRATEHATVPATAVAYADAVQGCINQLRNLVEDK